MKVRGEIKKGAKDQEWHDSKISGHKGHVSKERDEGCWNCMKEEKAGDKGGQLK